MRFNHPEILALLFLLVIPVLIHLFQLQRFRKVPFTNVKFLREIELESRKSSRLKKLLILATRMLAFACLILAFAQPVLSGESSDEIRKTIIYLDNSLSMQAKDRDGVELLEGLKGTLIERLEAGSNDLGLITNDKTIERLDLAGFKKEVLALGYHPVRKELTQVILEAEALKRKKELEGMDLIMFSDFRRSLNVRDTLVMAANDRFFLSPVRAEPFENLSLDSLWISAANETGVNLQARLRSQSVNQENLSISLVLNGELYGKTSEKIEQGKYTLVEFSIPRGTIGNGAMTFTDPRLGFDNSMFFTLPKRIAPKVLVIGNRSNYLSSIYGEGDFETSFTPLEDLDQGTISDFDLVLLNELQSIPTPLVQNLGAYARENGNLVIISPPDPDLNSYQKLVSSLGIGQIRGEFEQKKMVSSVNYEHPFFENVFKGIVKNFQYPEVSSGLLTEFDVSSTLLGFEDGTDFISEIPFGENSIFWISSPLDQGASNFDDSPLIVPVFYNFSLPESKAGGLYKIIGRSNEMKVQLEAPGETALRLTNGNEEFIPVQQSAPGEVTLRTREFPIRPGVYQVTDGERVIAEHAFNYDRDLVRSDYMDLSALTTGGRDVRILSSPLQGVSELNALFSNRALWHLFIIFALFFILLEMLIHRFLKS